MAIITKAVIFVALVCAISALPVENGQEQQEAQVDLLSVDDIPDQDVGSTAEAGQVRDKRHGFYGGFGVPVVSIGYGGKCAISLSHDFPKLIFRFPSGFGGFGGYPGYYGGYGGGYPYYGGGYGYRR